MITNNISLILHVTGIITSSMLLIFISPRLVFEKVLRVKVSYGGLPELIERHWGMAIFITGLLLIWSGCDPAIRKPVLTCVALNDAACVVVYVAYLMGWA